MAWGAHAPSRAAVGAPADCSFAWSRLETPIQLVQGREFLRRFVDLPGQLFAIGSIIGVFERNQESLHAPALVSSQGGKFLLERFNTHGEGLAASASAAFDLLIKLIQ